MQLLERMESVARSDEKRISYRSAAGSLSYAQLAARVAGTRRHLQRFAAANDAIILHAPNEIAFPICFLAAIANGLSVLALPSSSTAAEVLRLAQRVSARLIFSDSLSPVELASDAMVIAATEITLDAADHMPTAQSPGELLLTSSGSTGTPKIVRRSAASLDAVAANMVEAIGITAEDHVLAAVPLAHSYGIEHGLLAPLWAGATIHLFDGLDLDAIAGGHFTVFPAVPSMLERLADAGASLDRLKGLRTIYSAGAPLPDGVRDRFVARFGRPIGQLYGATEIGTVTYRSGDARSGNDVGWPLRDVSIRTLDDGEIAIRSPSMFEGYVGDDAMLVDGHFLTGDLGRLTDDGALELHGRRKLLIDVGGLKVNPIEVEAALATHEQVAECLVVSMRQSETVSRLRAIIVPRDPNAPPTAETMRAFARARLASHKVPRSFELRTSPLPRSATGKVLRTMVGDS